MITCDRFDNCRVIGVIPERVRRGYFACRHDGVNKNGKTCSFKDFPEVDLEAANLAIMEGRSLGQRIARRRRGENEN